MLLGTGAEHQDAPTSGAPGDASTHASIEEAARFFGVSQPTVRAWIADGCPVVERGSNGVAYKLDLRAIHAWRHELQQREEEGRQQRAEELAQLRLELLGDGALTAKDGAALSAKARADMLRAEVDRVKLAQLRGELVPADELKLVLVEAFGEAKQRLRTLPDLVAREIGLDEQQADRMLELIDDLLDDLADVVARVGARGNDPRA